MNLRLIRQTPTYREVLKRLTRRERNQFKDVTHVRAFLERLDQANRRRDILGKPKVEVWQ